MADWQLMQEHGLETPVSGGSSAPRSLALPGNAGSAWERTTSGHSPSFPGSAWER